MTKLFDYWRSSASYRVRIALGLAGEVWESEVVDLLAADHKSEAHHARNPQGLVPVLEVDGHRFTQSLAQIEYLNETRNLALLPIDPPGRAQVRALAYVIAMEIHPICNLGVAQFVTEHSAGNITTQAWMQHFIQNGLTAYEEMAGPGDYSYGDSVTLADVCLMPQIYNAQRWGVDLDQFPKITRIKATLEAIPEFVAAYPKSHEV